MPPVSRTPGISHSVSAACRQDSCVIIIIEAVTRARNRRGRDAGTAQVAMPGRDPQAKAEEWEGGAAATAAGRADVTGEGRKTQAVLA